MTERKMEAQSEPFSTQPRPYDPPAVVYEAALEVRAGSPLGVDLNLDPLKLTDGP